MRVAAEGEHRTEGADPDGQHAERVRYLAVARQPRCRRCRTRLSPGAVRERAHSRARSDDRPPSNCWRDRASKIITPIDRPAGSEVESLSLTHAAEPGCQLVHQRIKIAVHVVLGRILIMHTGDLVCGASRAGRSLLRHREAGGWPSGIDPPSLLSTEFSTSSTSEAPETSFAMPTMSVQMARRVGPYACPTHPRECSSPAGFSTG